MTTPGRCLAALRIRTCALAAVLTLQPLTAEACSFSWRRGNSPAEIRENSALQVVRGTFRFEQDPATGHIVTDARGMALGRIETGRARYWNTYQFPLNEFSIECGAYLAPTGNEATGIFWISRERRNRRYRLMMWEGRYPSHAPAPPGGIGHANASALKRASTSAH